VRNNLNLNKKFASSLVTTHIGFFGRKTQEPNISCHLFRKGLEKGPYKAKGALHQGTMKLELFSRYFMRIRDCFFKFFSFLLFDIGFAKKIGLFGSTPIFIRVYVILFSNLLSYLCMPCQEFS
jgi:hypothetical protein